MRRTLVAAGDTGRPRGAQGPRGPTLTRVTSDPGLSAPAQMARRAQRFRRRSGRRASAAIVLPAPVVGPVRAVLQRVVIALSVLTLVALIVWFDSEGYTDNSDGDVDLLDAFYYATVTLSTAIASGPRPRNHSSVWSPTHCWLKYTRYSAMTAPFLLRRTRCPALTYPTNGDRRIRHERLLAKCYPSVASCCY